MLDHLHNSGSYKKLTKNPLKKISRNVALAIKYSSSVSSPHHKLIETNPITPRIYGLPKIHKKGASLRPIVNTIGRPTYLLAKFLALKLKPLVDRTESFVRDSASFIEELKDIKLDPGDILVSFDVVSLYTCIPINEAMEKLGVLNTLATRALRIFDEKSFEKEKSHLHNVFIENGYSRYLGEKAFLKAAKNSISKREPKEQVPRVHLPFLQGTTDKIVRILKKHNVPSTFRPLNTIRKSFGSVKDPIDPKDMKGVYIIPCSCGTPSIGETRRSINQRISEHATDLKHRRTRSSALAEHAEKTKHHVCIEEASVIARVSQFHHRNLGKPLRLKKCQEISIEKTIGRSVVAGS
eukprot:PITA_03606